MTMQRSATTVAGMNSDSFQATPPNALFRSSSIRSRCGPPAVALFRLFLILGLVYVVAPVENAWAIPSFARQTGLQCNECHTIYPQLTPFGRQFKLNGYTLGDSPIYEKLSAWAQGSFNHTAKDQPGGAAPHFGDNDNFAVDQFSLFYGGKVIGKVGAFLQGTYDGIGRVWGWDNMDVRFANDTTIGGDPLVYGVSVNNSPGVQDLWNTTPVWSFPFDGSGLAPTPAAGTLIEGGLGQISLGASAYAMWNDSLYGEAGLYHTISRGMIDTLTGDSAGTPKSDGVAPYWRLAWQQDYGSNNISLGTFGMYAQLFPDANKSKGSDSYTDVGLDAQYQYTGERDNVTARFSLIQEFQDLNASAALGAADNTSNTLRSLNTSVAYTYDSTIGLTAGAMHIWGNRDATLYGTPDGSPDSTALTLQADWLPFNKTPWTFYPWFNPRLSAQYVHYFQFDGSTGNVDGAGRNASDNDTLFLLMTLTF